MALSSFYWCQRMKCYKKVRFFSLLPFLNSLCSLFILWKNIYMQKLMNVLKFSLYRAFKNPSNIKKKKKIRKKYEIKNTTNYKSLNLHPIFVKSKIYISFLPSSFIMISNKYHLLNGTHIYLRSLKRCWCMRVCYSHISKQGNS